jgi:hypothetical protein
MAAHETDPKLKRGYTEMEDRWLRLAGCYCHPKSLNALRAAIAAEDADKS